MRISIRSLFCILLCALLAGCETTPKVDVDFNPEFSFAGKTRFAVLLPEVAGGGAVPAMNAMVAQRITRAVEAGLAARGYQIVEPGQAQMYVTFFVTSQDRADVHSYNTGFSYRRCWDPMRCGAYLNPEIDVRYYKQGTLLLDFIDPASKSLQWRGVTSKRLPSDPSAAERSELATEVVNAILDQFPPGAVVSP
jgi:hypothetical protein